MANDDKTFVGGVIHDPHPFFARIWLSALLRSTEQDMPAITKVVGHFLDGKLRVEYDREEARRIAGETALRLAKDPMSFQSINLALQEAIVQLHQGVHLLPQEGIDARSNDELWLYYDRHEQAHGHCAALGWLPVLPEQIGSFLREQAKGMVVSKAKESNDIDEMLSLMLSPEEPTYEEQEQMDLLRLVADIQAQPDLSQRFVVAAEQKAYEALLESLAASWVRRLEEHHRRYCFTAIFEHGLRPLSAYVDDVARLLQSTHDARARLQQQEQDRLVQQTRRSALVAELGLSIEEQSFFCSYRQALSLKSLRRYIQMYALYRMAPVLEGIARRLAVDLETVHWMLPGEVESALKGGAVSPDTIKRRLGSRFVAKEDAHVFERIASDGESEATEAFVQTREWRGLTANRGYATGQAFLLTSERLGSVPQKSVLVLSHTRPEFAPAFAQAAAVVCDQGGVTSHAAIMARECGIPCVVATKTVLNAVSDGDMLQVDANQGVVRLL